MKDGPIHFTILSNGAVLPDVPGYHTEKFVYPVGYKVTQCDHSLLPPASACSLSCTITVSDSSFLCQGLRTFPSMRKPAEVGDFEFEIRYGGIFPQGGPMFCVRQVSPVLFCFCFSSSLNV